MTKEEKLVVIDSLAEQLQAYPHFYIADSNVGMFETASRQYAPLAQLVEQLTLNQWAQGSSPWRCTRY